MNADEKRHELDTLSSFGARRFVVVWWVCEVMG
jgi:hypothetical protein